MQKNCDFNYQHSKTDNYTKQFQENYKGSIELCDVVLLKQLFM